MKEEMCRSTGLQKHICTGAFLHSTHTVPSIRVTVLKPMFQPVIQPA